MKVLWLCNVMLPPIARAMNMSASPTGGWLTGASEVLAKGTDIQLSICFPMDATDELCVKMVGGIRYYGYPRSGKPVYTYDPTIEKWLQKVLREAQPDLVHIWGTEYPQALAMTNAFNKPERTLISIQGLCSVCANHYTAQLPTKIQERYTLRDILRQDNVIKQRRKFVKRGEFEIKAMQNVSHIIGRTQWDRACVDQLTSNVVYHFCNETLRDAFYQNAGKWNPNQCERHSIFVSQATYPIKGFHMVLEAMPEILKRFPDAKIYTTGSSPLKQPFYRIGYYQKWLATLIHKNGLEDCVVFLGGLNEEQMCRRFLESNVFVSASSIENSPNSVGEAMLLGVPTVASYVGGTMDLLKDKEEGYLYQSDAPYMLAYYICKVFEDDEPAWEMGQKACEHALKTHDPQTNLEQLQKIYAEVYS